MTRDEHMAWCKERAREYLDKGDARSAIVSMLSDLGKHEETAGAGASMAPLGLFAAQSGDVEEARRFVEGFR